MRYPVSIYQKKRKRPLFALPVFMMACALFFSSCTKTNTAQLNYQNGVYFYIPYSDAGIAALGLGAVGDSVLIPAIFSNNFFSFYSLPDSTVQQDTFWLPTVRILGNTSNTARTINLVAIDSGTTAKAGKHYRLMGSYTMPADSFTTRLGVILLKSPDLADTTVSLTLQLQPSADFPAQMKYDTLTGKTSTDFYEGNTVSLKFTARPAPPLYWSQISGLFGTWSRVKYQFMYSVLGFKLGYAPLTAEQQTSLYSYYVKVFSVWQNDGYVCSYPSGNQTELLDENGNVVCFQ